MEISIFGTRTADRSGKVRWLLEEMGVSYKDEWLDFAKGDHESAAYLKINPLGRIPAVKIAGKPLFDSAAICATLADQHLDRKMAPPINADERGLYNQWMYFAATTIDAFVTQIMIVEDIPPGEVFDKKTENLLAEVRDAYTLLNQVLSEKEFLIGQFSAADICVGFHLNIANLWPEFESIYNEFPKLVQYLERLKTRPAAIRAKVFAEIN